MQRVHSALPWERLYELCLKTVWKPLLERDRETIRIDVKTWSGRDAVLRVRVGFTAADAPQRVPTIY